MSGERRYTEAEVDRILERAADRSVALSRQGPADEGLTLGEIQDIGREVGIAPDLVADAASALDRPGGIRRTWGLPLSVHRTVLLPRELTEGEWEHLVADLRTTFAARGRLEGHGGLRQWTNGNLHALLEPSEGGQRLRLGTTKGSAQSFLATGVGLLTMALVMVVVSALIGTANLSGSLFLAVMGLGSLGVGALQLPGWARTRQVQMDAIAERLQRSIGVLPGWALDDGDTSGDRDAASDRDAPGGGDTYRRGGVGEAG